MKATMTLCQSGEPPTWRAEYLTFDKREWGVLGVCMAAKALWPGLDMEGVQAVAWKAPWDTRYRIITAFPRPLPTTAGYAMNWYPEYNLLVYVNDWED